MELKPPRGTLDLLPPEASRMRALYDQAARIARLYGYRYVETPGFEHTELFQRTSGESSDIVVKEMYTFEDRGGRLVTLRPEGTAPIVRAFLERGRHGLPTPFKVFTVGTMWRYGRPQAGRLREFRQFDVEWIGEAGPAADVDVIVVGDAFLKETLKDSGAASLELQINSIGDETCRPAYRGGLLAYLRANRDRLRDEHRDRFEDNPMRVLDCKDEACRAVAADAPRIVDQLCDECRGHFDRVLEGLGSEGIKAERSPTLVRGLDYYTRTAFEWVSPDLASGQNSVGGGGRYDGLAEVLGGPPTPGVGFAIGLERLHLIRVKHEQGDVEFDRIDAFVVVVGATSTGRAGEVVRSLRAAGLSADMALEARPLGTQLKMAKRAWARFAVIVGEREVTAGTVTIQRLADGRLQELGLDQAIEWMIAGPEATA